MKPLLLAFTLSITAVAAVTFVWIRASRTEEAVRSAEAESRSQVLAVRLQKLEEERSKSEAGRRALESRVRALEATLAAGNMGASGAAQGAAKSEARPGSDAAAESRESEAEDGAKAKNTASREERLEEALRVLAAAETSSGERQAVWNRLAREGLLDDAILAFEAEVKEEPTNADRHAELGSAYVQKILAVGDGEKGKWASKADKAFDKALEIDPHHWEARFTKAATLSHWPPIFGKQSEATRQFEVLLAEQEARAPEPRFATTYLFLGNLYESQGNAARAREVWKKGLELFPKDAELSKKEGLTGE